MMIIIITMIMNNDDEYGDNNDDGDNDGDDDDNDDDDNNKNDDDNNDNDNDDNNNGDDDDDNNDNDDNVDDNDDNNNDGDNDDDNDDDGNNDDDDFHTTTQTHVPTLNPWKLIGPTLPRSSFPRTCSLCSPSGRLIPCQAPVLPLLHRCQFTLSKEQSNMAGSLEVHVNLGVFRVVLGKLLGKVIVGPMVSKLKWKKMGAYPKLNEKAGGGRVLSIHGPPCSYKRE